VICGSTRAGNPDYGGEGMAKIRVYELAKEYNMESKRLIEMLSDLGVEVKNHMSALEDEAVNKITARIKGAMKPEGGEKPPEKAGEEKPAVAVRAAGDANQPRPEQVRPGGPGGQPRPGQPRPGGPGGQPRPGQPRPGGPGGQARPGQPRPGGPGGQPRPGQPRPGGPGGQARPGQPRPGGPGGQPRPGQPRPGGPGGQPRPGQPRPGGPGGQPRPGQPRPGGPGGQARPGQPRPGGPGGQPRPGGMAGAPRPGGLQRPGGTPPRPAQEVAQKPAQQPKGGLKGRHERDRDFRPENEHFLKKAHPKKGKGDKHQGGQENVGTLPPKELKPIQIGESITVQDLARKMNKNAAELIKKLMMLGVMATINQEIDADTAGILAGEFGMEVEVLPEETPEDLIEEVEDNPADLVPRPCVVTVMGHVDHGKTSLLDAIRHANVVAGEAGGITQHIGAYQVEHNGKKITFLDTPGHEAFTAMRARGAQVTDIAILVVAADDGVMPQTIEAINHSKAANVPIIVAINKIDKPGANPDRVKQELTEHGLVPEEWGGDLICVNVSAKAKINLDELLEMILLVAEVQDYKANPKRLARGTVVEAELDKGRGPVATVLVQTGTLNVGDAIVAGTAFGRVRAMVDDKGRRVKKAGPSTPVEVLGLSGVPEAGDVFYAVADEKIARAVASKRINKKREEEMKVTSKVSLDDLFKRIKEGEVKDLNIIIKADVQGSIEALKQALERLSTDEVRVKPIHGGVGAITETDIMLASASNAIIIGFNVRPDTNARKAAEAEQVDMRLYRVIYNAIEDVKAAMEGMLEPDLKEIVLGRVEVRQTFKVSKVGTIAGCYVLEGKIVRDSQVRVIRDGIVVHEGKLDSLKRFKDDAKEVAQGYECGLTIENFNDIQEGDIIEAFTFEEIKREL